MMEKLNENWITENHIDFEYKKYLLLAYLQHVSESFHETRLYPSLSELVMHYRNIVSLRDTKHQLFDSFPGKLSHADFSRLKLVYDKLSEDDRLMNEIEQIIAFSIPHFESALGEGKKIYDFIESKVNIFPVGIVPMHFDSGYLLLRSGKESETLAFEYQITIYDQPDERYRAISLAFVTTFTHNLLNTFENIKLELLEYRRNFPNPATYVVETELVLPIEETLLPLAKRTLVKYLSMQGGMA